MLILRERIERTVECDCTESSKTAYEHRAADSNTHNPACLCKGTGKRDVTFEVEVDIYGGRWMAHYQFLLGEYFIPSEEGKAERILIGKIIDAHLAGKELFGVTIKEVEPCPATT